jgi:DNA polymerase-1
MPARLFVLDGPGYLFRAYHALPYLSTSRGVPVNTVLGMSTMLWKLLREERPDYLAVAWDPPGPTFRDEKFAAYKETRAATPDDLKRQIPLVMQVLEALRIPVLEVPGFEADDVLGTVVDRARAHDLDVVLVTQDKDMLQLVGPRVTVLAPGARAGEQIVYDADKVREKWGVGPEQIPDLLALMGDSIDNIPGVPGVGQKTAVKLIGQFGSVDGLYQHLSLVPGKLRETLAANRKQALLSRELATVSTRVPLADDLEALRRAEPDWERLRAVWTELELRNLLRQLPDAPGAAVAVPEEEAPLADAAALAAFLATVPAGEPLAVDWAGEGGPPNPVVTRVGLHHPAAGDIQIPPELLTRSELLTLSPEGSGQGEGKLVGGRRLIGHGIKHLIEWALAQGAAAPEVEDTAVAAFLLNPARSNYKIEEVAREHLGEDTGAGRPGGRARLVWALWEQEARELREGEVRALYDEIERPLVPVLAVMERHGIRADSNRLADFSKELDRSLEALPREIYALAGEEFNLGSPKQLATILFEKLGLPPVKKTKTGYSTDADVLEQLAVGHALPAKIIEHRTLSKLKSTYADALPGMINPATGRIHTSFNQMGAATGRLSSSNPGLQNIPVRTELGRRIRAAFVPEPGWRLVAADYSQVELRILAHVCGEESLVEAFRRGEDIHRRTAAEVFGVALEQVTDAQRDIAKTTNFSVIYGVTAFGLARGLRISSKEAQQYLDQFFARHPKVRAWLDRTVKEGRARGYVETLRGRRRYLPELRSGNPNLRGFAERMATNAPIQGTAADMIKIAMIRMAAALAEARLASRMLLQVHDELLFEAPPAEEARLKALAAEVMEGAMSLDVPLKVDVKAGDDWAQV